MIAMILEDSEDITYADLEEVGQSLAAIADAIREMKEAGSLPPESGW